MSDDPKQEYFSDGMAEDLMTDLSKISGLLVISRNSTFAYKGKSIETKQIAEKLGVRYVLEGSVRKAGEQVRINAQLIDATTDHHLWAERYDGKMDNIFDLQDKITQKIVAALAVKLAKGEQKHLSSRETSSIAAYDAFLKGMDYLNRQSRTAKTLSYFEKAVKLDPNYGRAYAGLARAYDEASWLNLFGRLGLSFQETRLWMRHYLQLAMKNPTSFASVLNAKIIYLERRYEEAIAEIGRAITLDPNDARSNWNMARALTAGGRPEEAIEYAKMALRIDPGCLY
jgi:TolB-like protein